MNHAASVLLAIASTSVTALLITPVAGQCKLTPGNLNSGKTHYQGWVKRDRFVGIDTLRTLDFAIDGDYRLLTANDCPSPTLLDRTHYQGIALEKNWAYVKMVDAFVGADAEMLPGPGEIVALTLDDPDRFVPVVLSILRANLRLTAAEREDEWRSIGRDVDLAIRAAAEDQRFRQSLMSEANLVKVLGSSSLQREYRLDPLIDELKVAESAAARNATVVQIVYKLASVDPGSLSTLMQLTKYPFIIAKRTIGGAAGTEIVVYVELEPAGANTADVYYFYLWSDNPSELIQLGAFYRLGLIELWQSKSIGIGEYSKIPLKKDAGDNTDKWYLRENWQPGIRIEDIEENTGAMTAFRSGVVPAHAYACTVGMHPHEGLEHLGVKLDCPVR